jgi:hypothetical protein
MTESQIKDKFTIVGVTENNIDQKLVVLIEKLKKDIAFQGYGNIKITTLVTKMSWKEEQLYLNVDIKVEK